MRLAMLPLPLFVTASILASFSFAMADEQIRPLVASGDWIAFAHYPSMTARPDVCVAGNVSQGVSIRADPASVQFRVTNTSWSLPLNVEGVITVVAGPWSHTFEIDDNTDSMVNAPVPSDVVAPLFAAMDAASAMIVTVGKAKPVTVSLIGSTKATNAFRTCAGINSNSKAPGSNPFE